MFLNTSEVELRKRTYTKPYNLGINQATFDILNLIFEFRLASNWHISRFLTGQDQNGYLYKKLNKIWKAGYLESFKVFVGSRAGMRVYYMLSKRGLKLLGEYGKQEPSRLKIYPKVKDIFDWGLFKHESQVVELASQEAKNQSPNLSLRFIGEDRSKGFGYKSDQKVEAFTPDYTVIYSRNGTQHIIYTEFERTPKSHMAMLNKVQRYYDFMTDTGREKSVIRFIFDTPGMETAFWLTLTLNRPSLMKLKIITTYLELLTDHTKFLEPIYATRASVKLTKDPKLEASIAQRAKIIA